MSHFEVRNSRRAAPGKVLIALRNRGKSMSDCLESRGQQPASLAEKEEKKTFCTATFPV